RCPAASPGRRAMPVFIMINRLITTNGEDASPKHPSFPRARRILLLVVISLFTILVHGYHMGTDDAAIYAPGIERAADPSLFPFGSEFFMHHAGLSVFPHLVAALAWGTRLPIEGSMLLWFGLAQFLLLWAAYEVARQCFRSERARWASVGLLA